MRRSLIALALTVITACSTAASAGEGSYLLTEWQIDGPQQLHPGETEVTVRNDGRFNHTLLVTDEEGRVMAATDLLDPGTTTTLRLNLGPGAYSFTCRIVAETPDGRLSDHFEMGMSRVVAVKA